MRSFQTKSLFIEYDSHCVFFVWRRGIYTLFDFKNGGQQCKVDNIGAGGYACPIHEDGSLNELGVNRKAEWRSKNQNGIYFKDIIVPSYQDIVQTVKREHRKLAHFKLIGWDFSVDTNSDPIFIEYNVCPGSNQITCGPTFGDLTEKVLEEVFIKKTLKDAQN